jgi:hypothetical protein
MGVCTACRSEGFKKKYWNDPVAARRNARKNRTSKKMRDWNLRFAYGITLLEWEDIFTKQGRQCAICKRKKPIGLGWATDHKGWHCRRGKLRKRIRAILCQHCNTLLGQARESVDILKAVIAYIRNNKWANY